MRIRARITRLVDVNIASHLLMDGFQDKYDKAIVVTADSDLVLPIQMVKKKMGKTIGVLSPRTRGSRELQSASSFYRTIRHKRLADCLFPVEMKDDQGVFHCPDRWINQLDSESRSTPTTQPPREPHN